MTDEQKLNLVRKYMGRDTIVTSEHLNQNFDKSFASVNGNIMINCAKLRDFLSKEIEQ